MFDAIGRLKRFGIARWWHELRDQSALSYRTSLLFESGVVVTSVGLHRHQ